MHHLSVQEIATFLLRVEKHEQGGLNRRCAVLAATTECDLDPAVILRRAARTAA